MGKSHDKIYADIEKELQESPVFYPPGTTQINETMTTETDGYSYYSRDIMANEYVGKIVDSANSTIFTYLKANKYLPAEKEDEDPYLDFDNL